MQQIEERAEKIGFSRLLMMENAGRAVADVVNTLFDPIVHPRVLAVCGTGNNGGDCAVSVRQLQTKAKLNVVLLGKITKVKTEEAKLQWKLLADSKMNIHEVTEKSELERLSSIFYDAEVILDGIFGTGIRPPLGEPYFSAIKLINESRGLKVAIDLPSGLDPDSGNDAGLAVKADITIALHALKPGLVKRTDLTGYVIVKSIGIPDI
jgi:NAD(P)H-hydrate epimerase